MVSRRMMSHFLPNTIKAPRQLISGCCTRGVRSEKHGERAVDCTGRILLNQPGSHANARAANKPHGEIFTALINRKG